MFRCFLIDKDTLLVLGIKGKVSVVLFVILEDLFLKDHFYVVRVIQIRPSPELGTRKLHKVMLNQISF